MDREAQREHKHKLQPEVDDKLPVDDPCDSQKVEYTSMNTQPAAGIDVPTDNTPDISDFQEEVIHFDQDKSYFQSERYVVESTPDPALASNSLDLEHDISLGIGFAYPATVQTTNQWTASPENPPSATDQEQYILHERVQLALSPSSFIGNGTAIDLSASGDKIDLGSNHNSHRRLLRDNDVRIQDDDPETWVWDGVHR